jgi:DNA end-binding protein Ku
MARPSWSGFLRFNLISVPVKGFNAAATGGGKIGFHLLHAECGSRIRYKKVCPIHGEVKDDEIVSGYEAAKGQYVTVAKEERAGLKAEDEKTISVDAFVEPDAIDPIYYSGRSYFLVPDGKAAQKPYSVMLQAMREENRFAIAQVVFSGKAQVAVVRPTQGILSMSLLSFESEVKKPTDFTDEVETAAATNEEKKLAETLIDAATTKEFDLGDYKDEYSSKLADLVQGKVREMKPEPSAEAEHPPIINLMDALRKSLAETKGRGKKAHNGKPGRRAAAHRKTG